MDSLRSLKCRALLDENTDELHVEVRGKMGPLPDQNPSISFCHVSGVFSLEGGCYPTSMRMAKRMHLHHVFTAVSTSEEILPVLAPGHIRLQAPGWLPDKYIVKLETISSIRDASFAEADWMALKEKDSSADEDLHSVGDFGCQKSSDDNSSSSHNGESDTTTDTDDIIDGRIASVRFGPLVPTTFRGFMQLGEVIVQKAYPGAKLYEVFANREGGPFDNRWNFAFCQRMSLTAWFVDHLHNPPLIIELCTDKNKVWSAPLVSWIKIDDPQATFEACSIETEPAEIFERSDAVENSQALFASVCVLSRCFASDETSIVFHRAKYRFGRSFDLSRLTDTDKYFDASNGRCITAVHKLDPVALGPVATVIKHGSDMTSGDGQGWSDQENIKYTDWAAASINGFDQVEEILGHKFDASEHTWLYHVKWLGCDQEEDNTWEPATRFENPEETLFRYWSTIGREPRTGDSVDHAVDEEAPTEDRALVDRVAKLEATLAGIKLEIKPTPTSDGTGNPNFDRRSDNSQNTSEDAVLLTPTGSQSIDDEPNIYHQGSNKHIGIDDSTSHCYCTFPDSWPHDRHGQVGEGHGRDEPPSQTKPAGSRGGKSVVNETHSKKLFYNDEGQDTTWSDDEEHANGFDSFDWPSRHPIDSAGISTAKQEGGNTEPHAPRVDDWFADTPMSSPSSRDSWTSNVASPPPASNTFKSGVSHAAVQPSETGASLPRLTYITEPSSGQIIWMQEGLLEMGFRPWLNQTLNRNQYQTTRQLHASDGSLSLIDYDGNRWTKGPVFPAGQAIPSFEPKTKMEMPSRLSTPPHLRNQGQRWNSATSPYPTPPPLESQYARQDERTAQHIGNAAGSQFLDEYSVYKDHMKPSIIMKDPNLLKQKHASKREHQHKAHGTTEATWGLNQNLSASGTQTSNHLARGKRLPAYSPSLDSFSPEFLPHVPGEPKDRVRKAWEAWVESQPNKVQRRQKPPGGKEHSTHASAANTDPFKSLSPHAWGPSQSPGVIRKTSLCDDTEW